MSYFNGAVKVDREKIINALEWAEFVYDSNNNFLKDVKAEAITVAIGASRWSKFWYGKGTVPYTDEGYLRMFYRMYGTQFSTLSDYFLEADLIDDFEYKILNYHSRVSYGSNNNYNSLKALVSCGDRIFLSPSQASYVDSWDF